MACFLSASPKEGLREAGPPARPLQESGLVLFIGWGPLRAPHRNLGKRGDLGVLDLVFCSFSAALRKPWPWGGNSRATT